MKQMTKRICAGSLAAFLMLGAQLAVAQPGGGGGLGGMGGMRGLTAGGMDPQQLIQQLPDTLAESLRPALEITNEEEWKIVADRLRAVIKIRIDMAVSGLDDGSILAMMGRGARLGGRGGGMSAGAMSPAAEVTGLQNAIDLKGTSVDLQRKIDLLRAAKKQKEAKLAQANRDLLALLSVRQEATLFLNGVLP